MITEDDEVAAREERRTAFRSGQKKWIKYWVMPSAVALLFGIIWLNLFEDTPTPSGGPGVTLTVVGFVGTGLGLVVLVLLSLAGPGVPMVQRQHLGGAKATKLAGPMKRAGVPLGHVRMPETAEPLHTLIEGATGTGKTQLLKQMIDFIRARGDALVVVDSGHEMHRTFGRPGDLVLSVFDGASPGWLPQNEVRAPSDWSALAQSFIGDGKGEAQQWHQMAKAMFAATARGYAREVEKAGAPFDHRELFHLLTGADAATLAPFLKGTAAASLGSNDKALNNVRMTFFETLKFWELLRPSPFSVREWVEHGGDRPSIFIPHTKRQLPESKNLISCWLDQIITTACDRGEDRDNRVWVIIDELSSLGEIPSLKAAVTELRKTGFRVVVGIQNFEQVEDLYGRSGAVTVTNSLSNKVILRATDAASAERQSKVIGDARHRVFQVSRTSGEKASHTQSARDEVERVVLPSEIMALPDLTAFVKLAGADTVHLTPIPVYRPQEGAQGPWKAPARAAATPPPPAPEPVGQGLRARLQAATASPFVRPPALRDRDVALRRDGLPRVERDGRDVSGELFGPEPSASRPPPAWMTTDDPDTLRRLALEATEADRARSDGERAERQRWSEELAAQERARASGRG